MKMTKELRKQIDKNGHVIVFILCAMCQIVGINNHKDEEEIMCHYCYQTDKVV